MRSKVLLVLINFVIWLLFAGLLMTKVRADDYRAYLRGHEPAVFKLEPKGCTAWVLRQNIVITAAHCSRDGAFIIPQHSAVLSDGRQSVFEAKYVGTTMSDNDIAVLVGQTRSIPSLSLAESDTLDGERCLFIGHGGLSIMQILPCVVNEVGFMGDESLVLDAEVIPGDSGGPVIGREGKVIGIIYATSEHKYGYVAPAHKIWKALKRIGL